MSVLQTKATKVLLMGSSGVGKTSMRSVIFADYMPGDTARLSPTLSVQHSQARFLGAHVLALWDCGGQSAFYDAYMNSKRAHIFSDVSALVFVFDAAAPAGEGAAAYAQACAALAAHSGTSARVFALVHKTDLLPEADRDRVLERAAAVAAAGARAAGLSHACYATSIWDESLYRAWSAIVNALIPNVAALSAGLARLADACDAEEVVLFEKATFLVIASAQGAGVAASAGAGGSGALADPHRFEKISSTVKSFKLACAKAKAHLTGLRAGGPAGDTLIAAFTSNTYILVVATHRRATDEATLLNVSAARPHFERIIQDL